ncbi:3'-5'-cyclic-nucleotide phosphodiesterase [Fragilaria crotonensis]|nr:3'-5'-cyclic-nucleotide phosphodiesterase [Fragilaria crotonensis]
MSDLSSPGLADEGDGDIVYEVEDGDNSNVRFDPIVPGVMQSTPPMAMMALKITMQPWSILGHGTDPNVAASHDMTITVERVTSLFLIRIVAIVCHRNWQQLSPNPEIPRYSDMSTTLICTEALNLKKPWPKPITTSLIQQIREFVRNILAKYNDVHYHSFEHAYHVTISLHKLMDMMLMTESSSIDLSAAQAINRASISRESARVASSPRAASRECRKTYGLKDDPLMSLAMLFSALVHDVEHRGVPNRQLVQESHELAILYNDQSVAEQRSLAVAFSELMKDEYQGLRGVMFENNSEYHRFRKAVINSVLATDIASPERTQLVKSKWKEAFGETSEAKQRKKIKEMSRRHFFTNGKPDKSSSRTSASLPANWRGRQNSRLNQVVGTANRSKRRGSFERSVTSTGVSTTSMMSDLTFDPSLLAHQPPWGQMSSRENLLSNIHDDESGEESTAATPDSNDHMESSDGEDDDDIVADRVTMSAVPTRPPPGEGALNGFHNMTTPVIKGGKSVGKDQSPETSEASVGMTNMLRQSTDSFVPNAMMTSEKRSARQSTHHRDGSPKMNRRSSNPENVKSDKSYSVRLSIRRSLDLTGEAIDNYSRSTRTVVSSYQPNNHYAKTHEDEENQSDVDDADELKASVVMEHLMRAADIGPNMQGWQQMKKWANRLFFELKATHDDDRGEDPQANWFENQITFLESYIMPLARRLNDMGVFGDSIGPMFEKIVQQNRERWVSEGIAATAQIVQEWQISKGEKHRLNQGW